MERLGCTAFGEIFGGERFEFEHKGFLFPRLQLRSADAYGLRACSAARYPLDDGGNGENGKDKPVILVTHYPLMDGDVDNWYEVTDAVRPTTCACLSAGIIIVTTGIYVMTAFRAY